jgi:hypothetical protein
VLAGASPGFPRPPQASPGLPSLPEAFLGHSKRLQASPAFPSSHALQGRINVKSFREGACFCQLSSICSEQQNSVLFLSLALLLCSLCQQEPLTMNNNNNVDFDATQVVPVPPPPPRSGDTGGTNSVQVESYAGAGVPFLEADTGGSGSMRLGMTVHEYINLLLDHGTDESRRLDAMLLAQRLDLWGQGFFVLRASVQWTLPPHLRKRYRAVAADLLYTAARTVQI